MNKSKIMLSALCLLIVASCKKASETPTEPQASKSCRVTQILNSGSPTVYLTYNSDGKLSRIDNGSAISNDFETLTYTTGKITNYYEYPTGTTKATGSIEYTLDANGRVSSVKGSNGNTTTFSYDSNDYLTQGVTATTSGNRTLAYTWTNGNLTKITEPNGTVTTLTYSNETTGDALIKSAILPSNYSSYTGFDISLLAALMGKSSTNLIATSSSVSTAGTYQDSYTYTKDADGKIVKMVDAWTYTTTAGTTTNKNTIEFGYSCN